jgi:hypothetical protein
LINGQDDTKRPVILVIGAGAIGRGFLPWILDLGYHRLVFVDSNRDIISQMRERGSYISYRVRNNVLESHRVEVSEAYLPEDFDVSKFADATACFICVGPRSAAAAGKLMRGTQIPLVLAENDSGCVDIVKSVVGHNKVTFAVPDVITSNSAPDDLLLKDTLSVITESGVLFMETEIAGLHADYKALSHDELLHTQWVAKLYIHNTPHCIAAYLGSLVGARYLHQAMQRPRLDECVAGAMQEMNTVLKMNWEIPHSFLDWYAEKELSRFRCELLFDPISRVAREPLRKLELSGRLIGAAQICLAHGLRPKNILLGIVAALMYEKREDADTHLGFMRRALSQRDLNHYILGLRSGEALDLILCEHFDMLSRELNSIVNEEEAA